MATKPTAAAATVLNNPGPYKFRNVSPMGDLDLPDVGIVPAGEEFEVADLDLARGLYWQPTNYKSLDTGVDWGTDPAAVETEGADQ